MQEKDENVSTSARTRTLIKVNRGNWGHVHLFFHRSKGRDRFNTVTIFFLSSSENYWTCSRLLPCTPIPRLTSLHNAVRLVSQRYFRMLLSHVCN